MNEHPTARESPQKINTLAIHGQVDAGPVQRPLVEGAVHVEVRLSRVYRRKCVSKGVGGGFGGAGLYSFTGGRFMLFFKQAVALQPDLYTESKLPVLMMLYFCIILTLYIYKCCCFFLGSKQRK